MTIYEIDEQITSLIDEESGEIRDFEAFEALQMERNAKIDNMAAWVVDLKAQAKAIAEQIKVLQAREQAADTLAQPCRVFQGARHCRDTHVYNLRRDAPCLLSPICKIAPVIGSYFLFTSAIWRILQRFSCNRESSISQ